MDKLIWKIVLDFVILLCLASPLLYFTVSQPAPRGFFADDLSLRLPYKPQTVPEVVLAPVGFGLVIFTVLIVEYVRDKKGRSIGEKFLCDHLVPGWAWESYTTIGVFTFGAVVQQMTSEVIKQITSRQRPHFIDVCQPIYNASDPANAYGFVQVYSCADPDDSRVRQLYQSFPSAHASFAMYVAVFYIIYLQLKCKWRGSKLLRHAIQFLMFLGALYAGLSRVVEHFHHRDDVAVGFVIGAVTGYLVVKYVLKPKKYVSGPWQESVQQNGLPRPVLAR